jgi:hypothetical protein
MIELPGVIIESQRLADLMSREDEIMKWKRRADRVYWFVWLASFILQRALFFDVMSFIMMMRTVRFHSCSSKYGTCLPFMLFPLPHILELLIVGLWMLPLFSFNDPKFECPILIHLIYHVIVFACFKRFYAFPSIRKQKSECEACLFDPSSKDNTIVFNVDQSVVSVDSKESPHE